MVTSVNSKMTAIADAIRNLLDISGTMGLDAMASNISSITKRGAVAGTISTKSEQYIIPAGYHNGNGTVGIDIAEQAKIIAENIKNGVTILGVSGTASGDAYAVIAVTYPAGSVCTCTDGSKTLKLKDTSGQGFFLIPYAAAWTVTATDGTNTKAQSVEITSEGQSVSVTLSYQLYLFDNGVVSGIAWDKESKGGNGGTSSSSVSTTISLIATSNLADLLYSSDIKRGSSTECDLSSYQTLNIDVSERSGGGRGYKLFIGTTALGENTLSATINSTGIISFDISAINGSGFVSLYLASPQASAGTAKMSVRAVWLE